MVALMNNILKRCAPQLAASVLVLLLGGWFASYTHQQRRIGALEAETHGRDSTIKAERVAAAASAKRAASALRAADSIGQLLVESRARATHSDALATELAQGWATFRDQVLHAPPGAAVPSIPVVLAKADSALTACTTARADCKVRADREQQRGDSARTAAKENGESAQHYQNALGSSQENERKLKAALPTAAGKVTRAAWWAGIGGGVVWAGCRLGVLRC
jgi:hypothetical protein